jgi:two-component system, NarL family, response regulator
MSEEQRIRVLIADDHPVVRRGLSALLEDVADMTPVGEAATGKETVDLYLRHRPDVILLDLRMPEMDGVAAIAAIRQQCANARIIVLTTYDGDDDIARALRAGAQAYLLKDAPPQELIETIQAVHAGQTYLSVPVAAKLAQHMREPALTPRERAVLCLLVAGKTNKQIEAALRISRSTAKTHVSNILHKLGVTDRTQAVSVALKRGLVRLE